MARRRPLRFFLDNCVPDSVGRALAEFGHEVMYQRNAIVTDAPDVLVALASAQNDAILVTFDKDHKAIASRFIPAARRADWYARRVGVAAAREINEIPAARQSNDESRVRAAGISVSHGRLKRLSRIDFNCEEPIAARRIRDGMSFIEAEWRLCQKAKDRRMFIAITTTTFRTIR